MTRKRFIKLLLAEGWSLRAAEAWAWAANENETPYGELYHELEEAGVADTVVFRRVLGDIADSLLTAGRVALYYLAGVLCAVGEIMAAFGRRVRDEVASWVPDGLGK